MANKIGIMRFLFDDTPGPIDFALISAASIRSFNTTSSESATTFSSSSISISGQTICPRVPTEQNPRKRKAISSNVAPRQFEQAQRSELSHEIYSYNDEFRYITSDNLGAADFGVAPSRDQDYEQARRQRTFNELCFRDYRQTTMSPLGMAAAMQAQRTQETSSVGATLYTITEEQTARMRCAFDGPMPAQGVPSEDAPPQVRPNIALEIITDLLETDTSIAEKEPYMPDYVSMAPLKHFSMPDITAHFYGTTEGDPVIAYAHASVYYTTEGGYCIRQGELLAILNIDDKGLCRVRAVEVHLRPVFGIPTNALKVLGKRHWKTVA